MTTWLAVVQRERMRGSVLLLVLTLVYLGKAYYSHATSDDLTWVIAPTAWLVDHLTAITFVREIGSGWVSLEDHAIIAPACAGVNFMLIAFSLAALLVIKRQRKVRSLLAGLVAAGVSAYLLTLGVNTLRIWLSVRLYQLDIYSGWLTPERLHRIAGAAVYYLFLYFYYLVISYSFRYKPVNMLGKSSWRGRARAVLFLLVPLVWYQLFALWIPWARQMTRTGSGLLLEHIADVVVTSISVTLGYGVALMLGHGLLKLLRRTYQNRLLAAERDMLKTRILIVEDEPAIAETIQFALEMDNCETRHLATGSQVLTLLGEEAFDLVILDVGLPDISGMELCKEIRKSSMIPIIFLTARSDEIDRVVGLEIGADDYVVKPFSPRELAARVKVILRRSSRQVEEPGSSLFEVCTSRRQIRYCRELLDLSRYEYNILQVFIERPGQVFSRDQLMEKAWNEPEASMDRTVDAHIKNIRAKLKQVRADVDPIVTHRGVGYALIER